MSFTFTSKRKGSFIINKESRPPKEWESNKTEETSKNQEIFILIKEGDDWKISRYIFNSWS